MEFGFCVPAAVGDWRNHAAEYSQAAFLRQACGGSQKEKAGDAGRLRWQEVISQIAGNGRILLLPLL